MTIDQESLGHMDHASNRFGGTVVGMHPLHQASRRINEFREGRSLLKAKDLVGLLLCHGARAWRASQPAASPRLVVYSPVGDRAIRLRIR
ncbi:hypothetical protein Sa4125_22670 [Aureimonas sp. SA4125]|uniref:hypothetical protein n=1 Tax=Aureimonas sp. SA4125 TaxID=2826993 RepID=UPI001CC73471|nr:hypothetical protein [Aureimonas sp. SA4125]BDA84725.1 hypothetical protein Sa4125_22670 [Aureimonas sp. SA4125]